MLTALPLPVARQRVGRLQIESQGARGDPVDDIKWSAGWVSRQPRSSE